MHTLFDPFCLSIMSSRPDMHLWSRLALSFVLVPPCRLGLHSSRQMAFCLAELHLWSTKSSLQVKGSTYRHVQSPALSIILSMSLFSRSSHSVVLRLFLSSLTLFSHLVPTSPVSALTIWLSVNTNSHSVCFHFLFALYVYLLNYTWHSLHCFYNLKLYLYVV